MLDVTKYDDDQPRDEAGRWTDGGGGGSGPASKFRVDRSGVTESIGQVPMQAESGYHARIDSEMTPDTFLSLSVPLASPKEDSLKFLREAIRDDSQFIAPPWLRMAWQPASKSWQVTGHEGRHRMLAARSEYGAAASVPVHLMLWTEGGSKITSHEFEENEQWREAREALAQRRFIPEKSQRLKAFDPDQPRDESGKWSEVSTGEGGSRMAHLGPAAVMTREIRTGSRTPNVLHLQVIETDPDERGKGWGKKAMTLFLREADEKGLAVVLQAMADDEAESEGPPTEKLVEWYESFGFRNLGEHPHGGYKMRRDARVKKFDPDQPRDDHGRWTDGTGGGSGGVPGPWKGMGQRTLTPQELSTLEVNYDRINPKDRKFISNAMDMYLGDGEDLNGTLRKAQGDPNKWGVSEHQQGIRGMTRAFEQAATTLDRDITVFRGYGSHGGKLQVGMEFIDHGFVSTSPYETIAEQFGDGVVAEIKIPKGTRVLAPAVNREEAATVEPEVLLPRGMQFRVTEASPTRIKIEVVSTVKKFDPDQPRDDAGKWTAGGGGSAVASNGPTTSWRGEPLPRGVERVLVVRGEGLHGRDKGYALNSTQHWKELEDHLVKEYGDKVEHGYSYGAQIWTQADYEEDPWTEHGGWLHFAARDEYQPHPRQVQRLEDMQRASLPDSLDDVELDVLSQYTDMEFASINKAWFLKSLRREGGSTHPATPILDDIMQRTSLSENTFVYRGINLGRLSEMKPGQVYEDKGFISTSANRMQAEKFNDGGVLQIKVPKGTRALPLGRLSSARSEHEILLDRGTRFRVVELTSLAGQPSHVKGVRAVLEVIPDSSVNKAFNPDQPRDEDGKWTDGGGSSGAPLAMDKESRYARAREQGFDTSTVYYHGTATTFDSFKNPGDGMWVTTDPDYASTVHAVPRSTRGPRADGAPQVHQMFLRGKIATYDQYEDAYKRGDGYEGAKRLLREAGFTAMESGAHVRLWNPADLRSVHAKFDPKDADSAVLNKAFDPDQPRDDDGKWTSGGGSSSGEKETHWVALSGLPEPMLQARGYLPVMHGTAREYLESIRKDGLVPKGGRGADDWLLENMGKDAYQSMIAGDREMSVYLTSSHDTAATFAEKVREHIGDTEPVVLAVKIPWSEYEKSVYEDDRAPFSQAMRFVGTIKPDWIVGTVDEYGMLKPFEKSLFRMVYVVLFVDGKSTKEKYDDDQPRDEAGRWTDGGGGSGKITADDDADLWEWQYGSASLARSDAFGKVLQKLPAFDGIVYRGLSLPTKDLKKLQEGSTFKAGRHQSGSSSRGIAEAFAEDERGKFATVFRIKQSSGRKLGKYGHANEREVVLLKDTKYKVTSHKVVSRGGQSYYLIDMIETRSKK